MSSTINDEGANTDIGPAHSGETQIANGKTFPGDSTTVMDNKSAPSDTTMDDESPTTKNKGVIMENESVAMENESVATTMENEKAPIVTTNESAPIVTTTNNESTPSPSATVADKTCVTCKKHTGKYKCTKCRLLFCSVACGKAHKETHAADPDPPTAPKPTNAKTEATDEPPPKRPRTQEPPSRFSVLEQDPRMGQLFLKYPDLEDQLAVIEKAYRPPSYEDRIRTGWTTEIGKTKGMQALKAARGAHRGVAEYSELVTLLMSQAADGPKDGARDMMQSTNRAEQDEIRRLMALEGQ